MSSERADIPSSSEPLKLPKPDPDNITVLTNTLPNTPILPWNHYDSPWHEDEDEENTEALEDVGESDEPSAATEPFQED
ncbi:MAG: hypothetical protein KME06_15410 [Kastovskya adunca ATA6-11-RM4]|jgi:hypothetical protein|nr:hypothetical protein [Kastovskya adunca ATA6-11-RM4]